MLCASIAFLTSCSKEAPVTVVEDYAGRPVKIIEVTTASRQRETRHPAVIDAAQSRSLGFAVAGVISELAVNEAQEVVEGDLIARLDQRDFQSSLNGARATFSNAESDYARALELAPRGAISESELELLKAQRDLAEAQFQAAEKALSDSVLLAPFSGVIAAVPAEIGDLVNPGSIIASILSLDRLEATIQLPASVISGVQARRDLGAAVVLDAPQGREIAAEFSEAKLIADATSQTYAVTYSFSAPEDIVVLPGMNATVILRSEAHSSDVAGISAPLAAVQSDGGGTYVWVVDGEPLRVSRRNIIIEPGVGENVVVTDGLAPGDRIVAAGGAYLAEGLEVREWLER